MASTNVTSAPSASVDTDLRPPGKGGAPATDLATGAAGAAGRGCAFGALGAFAVTGRGPVLATPGAEAPFAVGAPFKGNVALVAAGFAAPCAAP
jgi:hypothetical protein